MSERVELQPGEVRGLAALAERMPEGFSLSHVAAHRNGFNGWLEGVYLRGPEHANLPGHELIGNRSVKHVEQMVDVMLASRGVTLAPRAASGGRRR